MTASGAIHYTLRLFRSLVSFRALTAVLSSFGALWLVVSITTFFLPDPKWTDAIRARWLWFGIFGLGLAVWKCRPNLSISNKLNGRDVTIEITIGDMFRIPGALIIGSNTTFDTRISRDLIGVNSVQGAFTRKYYDLDETQLDSELSSGLKDVPFIDLTGNRVGKKKRYPIGTCVRLRPKAGTAYFLAIADINEHGNASSTFENIMESLSKLWVFIGERGLKGPLVMPVLGTGSSRLSQPREEIVREIIKSFVAACSDRTFADSLTIVITPQDAAKHHISLDELGSFLGLVCRYTTFSQNNRPAIGTPA